MTKPKRSSAGPRKRKRTRRRVAPAVRHTTPRTDARPAGSLARALLAVSLGLASALCALLVPLLVWAWMPGPGSAGTIPFVVATNANIRDVAEALLARGMLASPMLFRSYATLPPARDFIPGEHLLSGGLSPRELVQRLTRGASRPSLHVTIPEGFQHLQIGERLEHAGVCSNVAFRRMVNDAALLAELGIHGSSAEGFLFPATYSLWVDSDAGAVVRLMVAETRKRLAELDRTHSGAFERLARERAMGERELLILASLVEKEARVADERPLIAGVFFNRLRDPSFRPARMLQSDPTAAYACAVWPSAAPSCADYHGTVTPAMLRDDANPYNTYRHAGLPPGPIANPGSGSIEAVLVPQASDYFYFVAKGGGRHAFSRSYAEHREIIEAGR